MSRLGKNPFRPGAGRKPPLRVGHAAPMGYLEAALDRVREGSDGDIAILYGPRGNGKTVLLNELRARAREKKVRIIVFAEVYDEDREKNVWRLTGSDVPEETTTTKSVQGGFPLLKGGMKETKSSATGHEAVIASLSAESPVLLLIDEAHVMPKDIGRALLGSVQRCIAESLPLFALLAGTPDVIDNLRGMGATFIERSALLPLGRLESERDVRDALAIPAKESGLPFDTDALDLLAAECQQYPYFLQLLGYAVWEIAHSRGHDRITLEDAREGVGASKCRREKFYRERIKELKRLGVTMLAGVVSRAMVAKGTNPSISPDDLSAVIRKSMSPDGQAEEEVIRKLSHIGLIWENPAGDWEPGIPSLCSFICETVG